MTDNRPPTIPPLAVSGGDAWEPRARELPLRAATAFAVRCAKRVEPLVRLAQLRLDAYSGAVDVSAYPDPARTAFAEATDATAKTDLEKLHELNLGEPGEPGEPIRWNDSRLGPLWPHAEPAWYAEAKRACYDLDNHLRSLPDPNAPPDDPALIAQATEYLKAQQWYCEGKFNEYRGEYVFFSDGIIFDHGRSLIKLRQGALDKAAALGIPPERVVDYFVPGDE